eukprot:PhF_6_TR13689/c4_g2_i1/m.22050
MTSTKSFECVRSEVIQLPSSWRVKRELVSTAQQCETVQPPRSLEIQTTTSAFVKEDGVDFSAQCDSTGASVTTAKLHHEGSCVHVYNNTNFSEEDVAKFLQQIESSAIAVLESNSKSRAFDGYEVSWGTEQDTITVRHVLTPPFALENESHAVQLEWNCNGTTLAVAYGRIDIPAWCMERGNVCLWSAASVAQKNSKPDVTLEQDAYVTSIAFHPLEPSTLALGTHTGDVLLLSVGRQDQSTVIFNSKNTITGLAHRDPVVKVMWVEHKDPRGSKSYWLCSVSGEGKILFWSRTNSMEAPWFGYQVTSKGYPVGLTTADVALERRPGMSAMNVLNASLVFGSESGEILLSRPSAIPINQPPNPIGKDSVLPILDVSSMTAHTGAVQSVCFSPFGRNIVVSSGSDGWVRMYSALERISVFSSEPEGGTESFLTCVAFSPTRPSVVAAVSRNAYLYVFDMSVSKSKPVVSVAAGGEGSPLLSVVFHPGDVRTLLTGDSKGNVTVWALPDELVEPTPTEKSLTTATRVNHIREAWTNILGVAT